MGNNSNKVALYVALDNLVKTSGSSCSVIKSLLDTLLGGNVTLESINRELAQRLTTDQLKDLTNQIKKISQDQLLSKSPAVLFQPDNNTQSNNNTADAFKPKPTPSQS